jgi:hypothetical protein
MKRLIALFFVIFTLFFSGCSMTHVYSLKENWIDDEDLRTAMNAKSMQELTSKFGLPNFTEFHGDTVEYVYNCRPHLYKTEKNGIEYKPTEKDREGQWSNRREMIALLAVGDKLIGIRHRTDYAGDANNTVKEEKSVGLAAKIAGAILGVGALITTIILVSD